MDYTTLDRAEFLIERADIACALPPRNPTERLLLTAQAAIEEQRIISALLACSFLDGHTLKFSCL